MTGIYFLYSFNIDAIALNAERETAHRIYISNQSMLTTFIIFNMTTTIGVNLNTLICINEVMKKNISFIFYQHIQVSGESCSTALPPAEKRINKSVVIFNERI